MSKIKSIAVTRAFLPPMDEYMREIQTIWDTHWLTNQGALHSKLESELQKYFNSEYLTLFTNGHLALDVAIKGLGLSGEVITTPFTFASTTHALTMNQITPVFCDIKNTDFTIDEEQIEELITEKTTAILPVHVYGNPCNVEVIQKIADRNNLKVVYDAAHAFGVTYKNKPIVQYGDVSMLSFHATKVFHTIEGGALIYNDQTYQKIFNLYKNFGITGPESVVAIGLNAKMNEFQAAMGIVNLRYIENEISKRKHIVELYRYLLQGIEGITFYTPKSEVQSNYAYFPIIIDEEITGFSRDDLFEFLEKSDIHPRKYFYPLITDFECYRELYGNSKVPVAKKISKRVLTLPLYSELYDSDIEKIVQLIKKRF